MSRKRASAASLSVPTVSCANMEDFEYEYYRPGCYCTPQAVRHCATPYTCAYLHEYPAQWTVCNNATYVVDAFGMVYYLSDFEHQLQLPSLTLETEITYHYLDKDDSGGAEMAEDYEEEAVSPRKRERFECESSDADEEDEARVANQTHKASKVYRAAQGYLVEEPSEADADPLPSK